MVAELPPPPEPEEPPPPEPEEAGGEDEVSEDEARRRPPFDAALVAVAALTHSTRPSHMWKRPNIRVAIAASAMIVSSKIDSLGSL